MGQKAEFPSSYKPSQHEAKVYELWEKEGAFSVSSKGGEYFSLVVPPPNANGNLHIGFGLTMAIEDAMARFHRLQGRDVLFVPGADHAGFETQAVYEKQLAKEGKSRFDFSREQLYQQIWDFVAENRSNFENQFRQLGASVNWDKFTFTLDEKIVKQVYATFKKMWDERLIYRGERLVNYCTFHGTAFADIEVEYRQEKSSLWNINYPLSEGQGQITVATTRPETMFGDVAVAVNPKDKKYREFIGKSVRLPLTQREIPIISDESVDMDFGTGAVKITPAHDPNDYDIGQKHQLPMVTVIDHEGKLNHEAPEYLRGLPVNEARKKTVETLEEQGYLEKVEPHVHSVGHCYKCGTVIQPLLREQWFVDMKPLAKPAIEALEQGKIKFYPDSKREQLIRYLKGLKDWNISRQIAWGIPIPAFRNVEGEQDWIFDTSVDQESIEVNGKKYERDPDVFDTWFSSSSWPYSTLNYPAGEEFKRFYPLSLMETGGEILYPWVSRMIMLGLYTTGEVPFKEVYIHGYVMAEDGSKMSKSVGNVVNADEIIAMYGSDAMRMGLLSGRVAGVNRPFDQRRVEEARNLTNKLWNVARFASQLEGKAKDKSIADDWMLRQLDEARQSLSELLGSYQLGEAYEKIYHYIWDDLADWYVEASKVQPNPAVMKQALDSTLKIMHPLAPFVTEAVWQQLDNDGLLAKQLWPNRLDFDKRKASEFEKVKTIVSEIRRLCAELDLKQPNLKYVSGDAIETHQDLLVKLARLGSIEKAKKAVGIKLNLPGLEAWLDVDKKTVASYKKLLEQRLGQGEKQIETLKKRLANKSYVASAPKELVDETKKQLEEQQSLTSQVKQSLESLL